MSMKKIQDILLETTAKYQEKSKLNVRFWNQDKDTAELRFIITRDNFPLSLSSENVKIIIALENGNNFIASEDFIIDTEVDGVARFAIPNDFMSVVDGTVTGQVYVGTLDDDEVIVQRQFEFTVSNDLLSSIPTEEKIRYIKMFDDLKVEIKDIVSELQEDLANMDDYVSQVNQTTQDGLTALTNLIKQKQDAYNANHTAKLKELNDKGTEYSNKFDSDKQYIDEKTEAFKESVLGSGLVTQGEATNWQKYKITEDDGAYKSVDLKNDLPTYQALAPGFYYTSNVPIKGMGQSSAAGWTIVEQRQNYTNLKRITFRPYNSNQEFVMRYYNEWGSWENALANVETTQGSQAKATTAENNANTYTDIKVGALHSVLFEGGANGVGQTINMTDSMLNYNLIIISGSTPAGDFDRPVLVNQNSGNDIIVNIPNLVDSDGRLGSTFELKLIKTSGTTLTIANDVSYDHSTATASGPNANKFTIKRIEGWK